ncbi:MAG: hypothetical protein K6E49_00270 [Lachnospiraceae bacterium]|nr:hypothetical protein [Lachnospiraceae bacterium]
MNGTKKSMIAAAAALVLVIVIFAIRYPEIFHGPDDHTGALASSDITLIQETAEPEAGSEPESEPEAEPASDSESSPEPEEEAADNSITLRFRNDKLLMQHYEKHGRDMGFETAKEYEAAAAAAVSNPAALHKTEAEDGDDVYYVEDTNEFVVVSTDGYIRTYFLPDSGIKYYNRQ